MIDANTLATPLEMASRVSDAIRAASADSLQEYTAPTRLSPVVLIDKKVMEVNEEMLKSLLQTLLSIYSAHYFQAINLELNVGDINVMKILDKFSTDRDILRAAGNSTYLSMEAWNSNIPFLPTNIPQEEDDGTETNKPFGAGGGHGNQSDNIKSIYDESNLAVGKMMEIKLYSGNHQIGIPVTVTLMPKGIDSQDLVDITSANSIDKSFKGRWHAWRSGEIRGVKDYLLCLDIIDAEKKAMLADKTGSLLGRRTQRSKGIIASLVSGRASPNAVSTMTIVSKSTAEEMEFAMKGKFRSASVREEYFKSNISMMLVVVDAVMERFTIYQRGIANYGVYTLADIKANSKRPGSPDIEAIMKAYQLGNAPTL